MYILASLQDLPNRANLEMQHRGLICMLVLGSQGRNTTLPTPMVSLNPYALRSLALQSHLRRNRHQLDRDGRGRADQPPAQDRSTLIEETLDGSSS